ncbi:hypothetical protein ACS0TY_020395 [Phlomoides rotata]
MGLDLEEETLCIAMEAGDMDNGSNLCLIGKVCTRKTFNAFGFLEAMKRAMAPAKGFTAKKIDKNLFSFNFNSVSDMKSPYKRFYAVKSSLELLDVPRLAETARISLTPQEVENFAPKIRQIVDWFGQLQVVDLHSVEPAIRADTEEDHLRDDVTEIFNNRDAIIAALPNFEDSYIKVPKVLNKE